MNRTLLAITIACIAALSGISAQERDVASDGANGGAVATQVIGIDTHWIGERSIDHYRIYGDGVTAEFTSVDTSTCAAGIETSVFVHGAHGVVYDVHRDPIGSNVVTVVVNVFDSCLNEPVLSLVGRGAVEQLQLNPNLKSANLRASFEGIDDAGNPVAISVDLVWNGAGQKDRTSDHARTQGVFHFVTNSTGTIRDAVAGGSVVVGGLDVTPLASTQGLIETNATRRLEIYR